MNISHFTNNRRYVFQCIFFFFGRSSLFYFVSIDMYSRFREPLLRQLYKKKILNNLIVLYFY